MEYDKYYLKWNAERYEKAIRENVIFGIVPFVDLYENIDYLTAFRNIIIDYASKQYKYIFVVMSITNNWCLNNFPIYFKKSGYDVKHFVLLAKEEELCRRITEANEDKKYAKDHYKEQLLYVHNNLMNEEIIYTDNLSAEDISNQIISMIAE